MNKQKINIAQNSLEYLGSIELARIVPRPADIVARGDNAAYDINRLWFNPLLDSVLPSKAFMWTIVPVPADMLAEIERYLGKRTVIDFDVKGDNKIPWYVLAVTRVSVAVFVHGRTVAEAAEKVRAAWEKGKGNLK